MYTPGESIEPYVTSPFAGFGGGKTCRIAQQGDPCYVSPYTDPTMCQHLPENVSMTPWIDPANIVGLASASGTIGIRCGTATVPSIYNDVLVFTANGSLPDIHAEPLLGPSSSKAAYNVPFSPANPTPVIVARCLEPGKLPSRIAYARRLIWDPAVNGSFCPAHDVLGTYRELSLPRCLPNLVGALCDGQSIVAMPGPPPATSAAGAPPGAVASAAAAERPGALPAVSLCIIVWVVGGEHRRRVVLV